MVLWNICTVVEIGLFIDPILGPVIQQYCDGLRGHLKRGFSLLPFASLTLKVDEMIPISANDQHCGSARN